MNRYTDAPYRPSGTDMSLKAMRGKSDRPGKNTQIESVFFYLSESDGIILLDNGAVLQLGQPVGSLYVFAS